MKIHLHMAYQKLGTANRAGLAVFMISSDAALINDGDEASLFRRGPPSATNAQTEKKPRLERGEVPGAWEAPPQRKEHRHPLTPE